jgi:hypothetical protein
VAPEMAMICPTEDIQVEIFEPALPVAAALTVMVTVFE